MKTTTSLSALLLSLSLMASGTTACPASGGFDASCKTSGIALSNDNHHVSAKKWNPYFRHATAEVPCNPGDVCEYEFRWTKMVSKHDGYLGIIDHCEQSKSDYPVGRDTPGAWGWHGLGDLYQNGVRSRDRDQLFHEGDVVVMVIDMINGELHMDVVQTLGNIPHANPQKIVWSIPTNNPMYYVTSIYHNKAEVEVTCLSHSGTTPVVVVGAGECLFTTENDIVFGQTHDIAALSPAAAAVLSNPDGFGYSVELYVDSFNNNNWFNNIFNIGNGVFDFGLFIYHNGMLVPTRQSTDGDLNEHYTNPAINTGEWVTYSVEHDGVNNEMRDTLITSAGQTSHTQSINGDFLDLSSHLVMYEMDRYFTNSQVGFSGKIRNLCFYNL